MCIILRCPANQVAVMDEVTGLLHCAPSPCGSTTCRNGGTCLAHTTKSYQCRCPEGFRGQWCEIGQVKSHRLATLGPSSILAISMCLLVFFGNYRVEVFMIECACMLDTQRGENKEAGQVSAADR